MNIILKECFNTVKDLLFVCHANITVVIINQFGRNNQVGLHIFEILLDKYLIPPPPWVVWHRNSIFIDYGFWF